MSCGARATGRWARAAGTSGRHRSTRSGPGLAWPPRPAPRPGPRPGPGPAPRPAARPVARPAPRPAPQPAPRHAGSPVPRSGASAGRRTSTAPQSRSTMVRRRGPTTTNALIQKAATRNRQDQRPDAELADHQGREGHGGQAGLDQRGAERPAHQAPTPQRREIHGQTADPGADQHLAERAAAPADQDGQVQKLHQRHQQQGADERQRGHDPLAGRRAAQPSRPVITAAAVA